MHVRRAAVTLVVAAAVVSCGAEPTAPTTVDLGRSADPSVLVLAPSASGTAASAGTIAWLTSGDDAKRRSARAHRPLLVFVTAGWDAHSMHVERDVLAAPDIVRASRGAVALRIDATDVDHPSDPMAETLGVRAVPTIVVMTSGGREVFRSVGTAIDVDALVDALGAP